MLSQAQGNEDFDRDYAYQQLQDKDIDELEKVKEEELPKNSHLAKTEAMDRAIKGAGLSGRFATGITDYMRTDLSPDVAMKQFDEKLAKRMLVMQREARIDRKEYRAHVDKVVKLMGTDIDELKGFGNSMDFLFGEPSLGMSEEDQEKMRGAMGMDDPMKRTKAYFNARSTLNEMSRLKQGARDKADNELLAELNKVVTHNDEYAFKSGKNILGGQGVDTDLIDTAFDTYNLTGENPNDIYRRLVDQKETKESWLSRKDTFDSGILQEGVTKDEEGNFVRVKYNSEEGEWTPVEDGGKSKLHVSDRFAGEDQKMVREYQHLLETGKNKKRQKELKSMLLSRNILTDRDFKVIDNASKVEANEQKEMERAYNNAVKATGAENAIALPNDVYVNPEVFSEGLKSAKYQDGLAELDTAGREKLGIYGDAGEIYASDRGEIYSVTGKDLGSIDNATSSYDLAQINNEQIIGDHKTKPDKGTAYRLRGENPNVIGRGIETVKEKLGSTIQATGGKLQGLTDKVSSAFTDNSNFNEPPPDAPNTSYEYAYTQAVVRNPQQVLGSRWILVRLR